MENETVRDYESEREREVERSRNGERERSRERVVCTLRQEGGYEALFLIKRLV